MFFMKEMLIFLGVLSVIGLFVLPLKRAGIFLAYHIDHYPLKHSRKDMILFAVKSFIVMFAISFFSFSILWYATLLIWFNFSVVFYHFIKSWKDHGYSRVTLLSSTGGVIAFSFLISPPIRNIILTGLHGFGIGM